LQLQQGEKIMKKYLEILRKVELFENIAQNELEAILKCLNSSVKRYNKDEFILLHENIITSIGIILNGEVLITKEDFNGNRSITAILKPGEVFGEVLACAEFNKIPVTVIAATECEVMFVEFNRIITTCSSACSFHTRLIKNMLKLIANKNILLNNKIEILSKRSIREKLSAFLMFQINKIENKNFQIDFNRNELADFLSIDRSAMSRELCKMRDGGIIEFDKNKFKIIDYNALIC
jgi:CRP/FNR family transcriptional regulator, dissimilatory nitrate respiration regulator